MFVNMWDVSVRYGSMWNNVVTMGKDIFFGLPLSNPILEHCSFLLKFTFRDLSSFRPKLHSRFLVGW